MDRPRKGIVSKGVTFDQSGPNTDVTRNKHEKYISFGLPGLKAEYFGDDNSTPVPQNLKNFWMTSKKVRMIMTTWNSLWMIRRKLRMILIIKMKVNCTTH